MRKEIHLKLAQSLLTEGVNLLADTVGITLGPNGKPVILDREFGRPIITKDGVTVARDVQSDDPVKNMGIKLVLDAAKKTNIKSGDGTTSSIIMTRSLIKAAQKVRYNDAIDKEVKELANLITKQLTDNIIQPTEDQLRHIAYTSSNGDNTVCDLVCEAVESVGADGVIMVEEGAKSESYVQIVDGLRVNRGFSSPYFITNTEKVECVLENPYILVTNYNINYSQELIPILEFVTKSNRSLLIIADNVDGEFLSTLVMNKLKGVLKVGVMKAPSFGPMRAQELEELSYLLGATFVDVNKGMRFSNISEYDLGQCGKVVMNENYTNFHLINSNEEKVNECIALVKKQIEENKDKPHKLVDLNERLSRLNRSVAMIYVGANSEVERKEMADRLEDALNAVQSSAEHGCLPGAGSALYRATKTVLKSADGYSEEAIEVISKIAESVASTLASNSMIETEELFSIYDNVDSTEGIDLRCKQKCDLVERGILDPAYSVITGFESAVSIGTTISSTGASISLVRESKDNE